MSVMLYPCMLCVALLMCLFVLCVACLTVLLFGETIRNVFGCSCYFVVECYGCVQCVWWCSVGKTMYGPPKSVCVVPVIPMSV